MERKDLVKLLDEIFTPIGFKRKGNSWVLNGNYLSKLINLQKSSYSNAFYINYGYIIRGLDLTTSLHVENRLASLDKEEQKRITNLLDLDLPMDTEQRKRELKGEIIDRIVPQIQSTNTENDLLNDLQKRTHLNDIPLVVKRHFNLLE